MRTGDFQSACLRAEAVRLRVTGYECPRMGRDFLEEERATMGERWLRQEYREFPASLRDAS
jgi:hypothetical protein